LNAFNDIGQKSGTIAIQDFNRVKINQRPYANYTNGVI